MAEDPLAPFRSELRSHCYSTLGSVHDAEDVLQEISLRVWRARAGFEGRSSLRTWMHRVAVNGCLNELARKERRVLPMDLFGRADADEPLREPEATVLWLDPYPEMVTRCTAALRTHDVEGMLALLSADVTWAMPPLRSWFHGREAVAGFLAAAPHAVDWRHQVTRANGQLAVGCYAWDEGAGAHVPYALDVLDVLDVLAVLAARGDRIATIISFISGSRFAAHHLLARVLA